jgi:large subunit ribosomal protein L31
MKNSIHPQFHTDTAVKCACGNTFVTGSTQAEIYTEICSVCHPFFTGKQKLLDTSGNLDRFHKRVAAAAQAKATVKPKKERKARPAKTA